MDKIHCRKTAKNAEFFGQSENIKKNMSGRAIGDYFAVDTFASLKDHSSAIRRRLFLRGTSTDDEDGRKTKNNKKMGEKCRFFTIFGGANFWQKMKKILKKT